jgi:hypothetical protein
MKEERGLNKNFSLMDFKQYGCTYLRNRTKTLFDCMEIKRVEIPLMELMKFNPAVLADQ